MKRNQKPEAPQPIKDKPEFKQLNQEPVTRRARVTQDRSRLLHSPVTRKDARDENYGPYFGCLEL